MTGPGPKSPQHASPLRVAFYGLSASELDLFTLVRRHASACLVLVVDPGPMGLARRLAEIAGVPTGSSPWDLVSANADLVVVGGLAHSGGAALERLRRGGAAIADAGGAGVEIDRLAEAALAPRHTVSGEETTGGVRTDLTVEPTVTGATPSRSDVDSEGATPKPPAETTVAERLPALHIPESTPPSEAGAERAAKIAAQADMAEAPPVSPQAGEAEPAFAAPVSPKREATEQRAIVTLQPMETAAGPASVVNWALEGLMSSVGGRWGAALARAKDEICFVEKGIDLQGHRPDLWRWLNSAVREDGASGAGPENPPQDSGTLAWALLRTDLGLVGAMLLGREEGGAPFSSGDRTWLQRVGERVASILSHTIDSDLGQGLDRAQDAPASVWAAPALDKVRWARGWVKGLLDAKSCWLFVVPGSASVPQLVDEEWGTAGAPFLQDTVQEALERSEPQVWLEAGGARALVLQPLGPWGVKGVLFLEGVPWRGDGRAALARLKKAAATIGRLLRNI